MTTPDTDIKRPVLCCFCLFFGQKEVTHVRYSDDVYVRIIFQHTTVVKYLREREFCLILLRLQNNFSLVNKHQNENLVPLFRKS